MSMDLSKPAPGAALRPGTGRWPLWASLLLLAGAAWALRLGLAGLSQASLHVDEAQYWDWSRRLQAGYYSKPPGIAALIGWSAALWGDGEIALRALAMACYPLTAVVLGLLGADLAHGASGVLPGGQGRAPAAQAGVAVALVFLASPLAGLLGQAATTDAPLLLCWALASAGLWWAVQHRRRRGWLLVAAASAAGLLSKYSFGFWMLGALVFVLRCGQRGDGIRLAGAWLLAAPAWWPNLAWNQALGWPTFHHVADTTLAAEPRQGGVGAAAGRIAAFALAQPLIGAPLLAPAWLAWWWRRRRGQAPATRPSVVLAERPRAVAWLLACMAGPIALAALVQATVAGAQVNWMLPAHLAGALLLGDALARHWPARRLVAWAGVQWALVALLVLLPRLAGAAGWALPTALDAWGRMRGWGEALAVLRPAMAAHPQAVLAAPNRTLLAQAGYHWRDLAPARAALQGDGPPQHHYALHCPWRPEGRLDRPLLWLSDQPGPPPGAAVLGRLEPLAQARVAVGRDRVVALYLGRWWPAPGALAADRDALPRGVCR